MRKFLSLVVLSVVALLGSCSSDSSNSEEKELRTLLNNEWEAVSSSYASYDLGLSQEQINNFIEKGIVEIDIEAEKYLLGDDSLLYDKDEFFFGMNKKGGLYFWGNEIESKIHTRFTFYYACAQQKEKKFTGSFNNHVEPASKMDLYVHKVDENTIKILLLRVASYGYSSSRCKLYVFKKIGAWNESTNLKSILEKYDYPSYYIELLGGENYERDVAQGKCQ